MQGQHQTLLRAFRQPSMHGYFVSYLHNLIYCIPQNIKTHNLHRICPPACTLGNQAVLSNHFPLIGRVASCLNAKVDLGTYITKTDCSHRSEGACIVWMRWMNGVQFCLKCFLSVLRWLSLIAICTDFSWARGGPVCTCLPPSSNISNWKISRPCKIQHPWGLRTQWFHRVSSVEKNTVCI